MRYHDWQLSDMRSGECTQAGLEIVWSRPHDWSPKATPPQTFEGRQGKYFEALKLSISTGWTVGGPYGRG